MKLPTPLYAPPDAAAPGAAPTASPESSAGASPPPDDSSAGSPGSPGEDMTDFSGLGGVDDDMIVVDEPEVETPPTEAVPVAEATPPAAAEPPKAPAAPATPPQAQQPQQPTPQETAPATPAAPSSPPADLGTLVQQLGQHKNDVIAGLAAERFVISKEDLDAFENDAASMLPKFMARTYYEAQVSTLLHVQNLVPQMVVNMVKLMQDQEAATSAFYGKYKGLDRQKHHADVTQFASVFKQQNPAIKQEDLYSLVAAAVAAKFGVANLLGAPAAPAANGTHPPQTPAPHMPPYVPARGGASVRVTPDDENPFAGLAQDHG